MNRLAIILTTLAVLGASPAFAAAPVAPLPPAPADEQSPPLVRPNESVPGHRRPFPADMPKEMQQLHEQLQALRMQGGPLNAEQIRKLQEQIALQMCMNPALAAAMPGPGFGPMPGMPQAGMAEVRREKAAFLGITTSPVTGTLREQLKIDKGVGLVVDFVEKDSPADAAGVKPHDILTKLDDQVLINAQQLAVLVRSKKAGDSITLTLLHESKTTTATAKLIEKDLAVLEESNPWLVPDRRFFAPLGPGPGAAGPMPEGVPWQRSQRVTVKAQPDGSTVKTFSDGQQTLTMTSTPDGKVALVAQDKDGKELFNGPINTAAERQKIPADVAAQLKQMGGGSDAGQLRMDAEHRIGGTPGNVRVETGDGASAHAMNTEKITLSRSDAEHMMTLSISGSGGERTKTLLVKDSKTGQVIFDGAVMTDEQRQALPADVARKLAGLEAKVEH